MSLPEDQWLIIVTDSDAVNNLSTLTSLLSEGQNIAFVHNSSSSGVKCEVRNQLDTCIVWDTTFCKAYCCEDARILIRTVAYQGGLLCHVHELLQSFVMALDLVIQNEENAIAQVSAEEWHAIQPSKYKRRSSLLDLMKVRITTDETR